MNRLFKKVEVVHHPFRGGGRGRGGDRREGEAVAGQACIEAHLFKIDNGGQLALKPIPT